MARLSRATGGQRGEASLQRLLEGVLGNMDLRQRFRERLAVAAWAEIAGGLAATHARAEVVRDGVLVVATDTPAWAQELHMRRGELVERLKARVGEGVIRDIHFRSGVRARKERPARGELEPREVRLSGKQERQVRRAAAQIADVGLRERAEKAFAALTRMTEWRQKTGWRRCGKCGQWQRVGRHWCASCTAGGKTRRKRWGIRREGERHGEK